MLKYSLQLVSFYRIRCLLDAVAPRVRSFQFPELLQSLTSFLHKVLHPQVCSAVIINLIREKMQSFSE